MTSFKLNSTAEELFVHLKTFGYDFQKSYNSDGSVNLSTKLSEYIGIKIYIDIQGNSALLIETFFNTDDYKLKPKALFDFLNTIIGALDGRFPPNFASLNARNDFSGQQNF